MVCTVCFPNLNRMLLQRFLNEWIAGQARNDDGVLSNTSLSMSPLVPINGFKHQDVFFKECLSDRQWIPIRWGRQPEELLFS